MLADRYEGQPLIGPNDVTIDGKGRLYFTELNGAAVYRIDAPGKLVRILAAPDIQRPNGIQSLAGRPEAVSRSNPTRRRAAPRLIRSYDLQPDGTVRNMRVLLRLLARAQRRWHEHRHARATSTRRPG